VCFPDLARQGELLFGASSLVVLGSLNTREIVCSGKRTTGSTTIPRSCLSQNATFALAALRDLDPAVPVTAYKSLLACGFLPAASSI